MSAPITSNVLLNALTNTFFSNNDMTFCKQMIQIINNNGLFKNQPAGQMKDCVGQINAALNAQQSRIEGLCLLYSVVDQCSEDMIMQYSHTWLNALVRNFQQSQLLPSQESAGQSENGLTHALSCAVMNRLLTNCTRFPEISRNVSMHFVPQIVNALLGATTDWISSALSCLRSVIRHFPAASGTFKARIEGLVIKNLDNVACHKEASACLAALSRCGSRGNQGCHHTDGWSFMFSKLLGSLGDVLNQLYQGFEPGQPSSPAATRLTLAPISSDFSPQTCTQLSNRYHVLSVSLCSLLSDEFSSVVKLQVDLLLKLLSRALAINNTMLLSVPVTRNLVTSCVIPDVHVNTLNILDALIICGKRHLLRYDNSISRLIMQCLAWTRQNSDSATHHSTHGQNYGFIREAVYNVAAHWLSVAKLSSGILTMSEFINHVISDIRPPSDMLKIEASVADVSAGVPPPKKRKRGDVSQPVKTQHTDSAVTTAANQKLCTAALAALRQLLQSSGPHLSAKSMKTIHGCIMVVGLSLQDGKNLLSLFTSPAVRQAIYHVLLTSVLVPHPIWPPPLHIAIHFFKGGMKDQCLQVSDFCAEAMTIAENMIHPRAAVLQKSVVLREAPITVTRGNLMFETEVDGAGEARMTEKRKLQENNSIGVQIGESEVSTEPSEQLYSKNSAMATVNVSSDPADVPLRGTVTDDMIIEDDKGDENKEKDNAVNVPNVEMTNLGYFDDDDDDDMDDMDAKDIKLNDKTDQQQLSVDLADGENAGSDTMLSRSVVDKVVSDYDSQNDASTVTYDDDEEEDYRMGKNQDSAATDVSVSMRKASEATEEELRAMLRTFVNADPDL